MIEFDRIRDEAAPDEDVLVVRDDLVEVEVERRRHLEDVDASTSWRGTMSDERGDTDDGDDEQDHVGERPLDPRPRHVGVRPPNGDEAHEHGRGRSMTR